MNPYLVERLQPFGTTIFAEMSALARRDRRDQPRAGIPRHRRARRGQGSRRRRDPSGAQPVPARDRHPRAAPGDPRAPATVLPARLRRRRRRCSSPRARPRRSRRRCSHCAGPATRSSRSSRTTTRTRRASRWPARPGGSCTLRPPDYTFDPDDLRRAITPRTQVLLLNSPHNPTGKVFTRAELALDRRARVEHDLLAVTDEVYEHLVYEGEHVPLATFPGMRDRTVTISSGRQDVLVHRVEGRLGLRPARARGGGEDGQAVPHLRERRPVPVRDRGRPAASRRVLRPSLRSEMRDKRDRLCAGLADAGLEVLRPQGTYFVTVDIRSLGETDGLAFCRSLPAPLRRGRRPERRVLRRARPGRLWCGSRAASGPRCSTKRARRPEGSGAVRVAGIQHDIVWERPRGELRAPRADDRARPPPRAPGSSS